MLRFLGVDNVDKNLLAREIVCSERAYKTINRAQAALYALHVNQVQLVAGSVEEAPSTTEGVVLRGNIFVKKMGMFGDVKRIQVSPVYATALANAAGVLCYVRRDMFDMCCVKLNDMLSVYTSGGKTRATERGCYSIPRDEDVERKNFVTRCETWELKADDVLALSDEELRVMLKSSGIGVTRLESREVLLAKIVGIMDEVERREIGIAMAANGGNYGMAGKLQKERSERGRLLTELKKAEREGRWGEVVTLAERAKWIEGGIMDVTAEPGSYQRDLDRDDWYRPNR